MKGKKSFILYADLISVVEKLSNEQAGILFKIIMDYVNDKKPDVKDLLMQIAFEPIKQQLKRDLMNWNDIRDERIKAGHLGGVKSGEARRKQKEANEASALKLKQKEANEADNVTVNVIDTVNDIVNANEQSTNKRLTTDKKVKKEKNNNYKAQPKDLQMVKDYFVEKKMPTIEAEKFYNHFSSNGWKVGGKTAMKDWKAAIRNWIININNKKYASEIQPL